MDWYIFRTDVIHPASTYVKWTTTTSHVLNAHVAHKQIDIHVASIWRHMACVRRGRSVYGVGFRVYTVGFPVECGAGKENTTLRASMKPDLISVIPNAVDATVFTPGKPAFRRYSLHSRYCCLVLFSSMLPLQIDLYQIWTTNRFSLDLP